MISDKEIDYKLIDRFKEGDEKAFVQLVNKYKDLTLSLAYSILKDRVEAEDVLQITFIKVYNKVKNFKQQSAFSSWLYRIVVNTAYNELKKEKRFPDIENENTVFYNIQDPSKDKSLEIDRKKFILLALERLRPDEALVLRLHYLIGYKIKEIKEITGFSNSKIKVDLHRGRISMEEELKNLMGDELESIL